MTNLDRIKKLNAEQMTSFLFTDICSKCAKADKCNNDCNMFGCFEGVRKWLEKEIEHD